MLPNITKTFKAGRIIHREYNEGGHELNLSTFDTHSDGYAYDWRSVLAFRDWSTLITLRLGKIRVTQVIAISVTLVLNW